MKTRVCPKYYVYDLETGFVLLNYSKLIQTYFVWQFGNFKVSNAVLT